MIIAKISVGRQVSANDDIVENIQGLKGVSKSMEKIVAKTLPMLGYE